MSKHRKHHHNYDSEPHNNFNFNNIAELLKNINVGQMASLLEDKDSEQKAQKNVEKQEIVNSFRTLLNADRAELIRTLVELYSASKNNSKK